MGRRQVGGRYNGNGYTYQDDLPERGPGAFMRKIMRMEHKNI
jgi:hypothetical protein